LINICCNKCCGLWFKF